MVIGGCVSVAAPLLRSSNNHADRNLELLQPLFIAVAWLANRRSTSYHKR